MISVIGDSILDTYVYGKVERISPEAPVPILLKNKETHNLGGAAYVASIIAANGHQVELFSNVFDDLSGRKIINLCTELNIPHKIHIEQNMVGKTPHKTRFIASNHQICRVDNETRLPNFNVDITPSLSTGICIISDYGKGTLTSLPEIMKTLQADDFLVLVDPKHDDILFYDHSYIVTPNYKEFLQFLLKADIEIADDTIESIAQAALLLILKTNIENIIITLSERGCLLITSLGAVEYFKGSPVEVCDVTGAGDTFVAFLAMALNNKVPLKEGVISTLKFGNRVSLSTRHI